MWYETITRQNYFAYIIIIMTQLDGLGMGAPSSGLIAEIFLQHTEHRGLPSHAQKHKMVNYIQYIDDMLMIFDSTSTTSSLNSTPYTETYTSLPKPKQATH
jgi:hypothetical protein